MPTDAENDLLNRDVRMIRRKIAKGFMAPQALEAILADLPDSAEQGECFDPAPRQGEAAGGTKAD